MLTKRPAREASWSGLALFLLGIALGSWVRPMLPGVRGAKTTVAPAPLATIELRLDEEALRLFEVELGAQAGDLGHDPLAALPAVFGCDGERRQAEIRPAADSRGSSPDSRAWEVRLSQGSFLGMSAFTLRVPELSGYLWRWLLHACARREDLLAPRSTFVDVRWNERPARVYLLEEVVDQPLFEASGRSTGPIFSWGEGVAWDAVLLEDNLPVRRTSSPPPTPRPTEGAVPLTALEGPSTVVRDSIERMRELRAAALACETATERTRLHQAMQDLRGGVHEGLLDVQRLGRAHALLSLFQDERAVAWEGMRFHGDSRSSRLEPILQDVAPEHPSARDPVPFRAPDLTASLAASPGYYEALFQDLGRMLRSDWLEELFLAVEPELARFEAALERAAPLPVGCTPAEMKQRLRAQTLFLRQTCLVADATNFEASYTLEPGRPISGSLRVLAWATTRSPVRIEGFRFSNGSMTGAAACLEPGALGATVRESGVVLPPDGRPVAFRFPMNERLANLETVEKVTRALRAELQAADTLDLDVRVIQRLLAAEEAGEERLSFRPLERTAPGAGRPSASTLEEVLERHPFLRYDPVARQLRALPGDWNVEGDLVLPSRTPLSLGPRTRLAFARGAVLLADAALVFAGTEQEPVVLEAQRGADSWEGVAVLCAAARSRWEHVIVRDTLAVARGGWTLTGGVTFYRSPVTLARCRFEGTRAEDALNIVGADVLLDQVVLRDCSSDAFDGDSVTGEVRACTFSDGRGDGLDVSGSDLVVRDCAFERLLDTACSVGERSRVRIAGGSMSVVAIGVASKDDSDVAVDGLQIRDARHYALAAFVEKPGYGPARLRASSVAITGSGAGVALAQTGCLLELDGVPVTAQDIDVEAGYAEGVLGRPK